VTGTDMERQLPQPERGFTPAEQHLGDRLAALIDGELGHDARDRVLSHLATCWSCKAEADAQRRVKNVFADTAPPPPSDGLLARLQGLPGCGPDGPHDPTRSDDDEFDGPGSGSGGRLFRTAASSSAAGPGSSVWALEYLRGGRGGSAFSPSRGFRIHETDRLSSRGRRFAFAAAGAFSLAALALGGGLGAGGQAGSAPSVPKGDSGSASASSVGTASAAAGTERDRRRRDSGTVRGDRSSGALSVSTTGTSVLAASMKSDGNFAFHRHAPWAAPSAPPAAQERRETVHPLLRDAFFASPLTRSALPSVTYDSYGSYDLYGTESQAGAPWGGVPGRTETGSTPAPSPVTTAAPPHG
jgi:hypothetical protein